MKLKQTKPRSSSFTQDYISTKSSADLDSLIIGNFASKKKKITSFLKFKKKKNC